MQQRNTQGRRTAVGLGLIVAGAVTFVGALPGYASGAQEVEATSSTSLVEDNPTCGDLAPPGASWTELKVEPVEDGTFTDGTLTVTIDVTDTADGQVFSWTSNIGVDAVFVKGGPGGLLYTYDPPAESTGDTGLHAPVNPNNNMFFGLSHVSFCYDVEQETTTTTEKDTTTTTERETTTTTEQGTTTSVGGTSTTAAGVGGATTTTMRPGAALPKTGSNTVPLLALGAVLLGAGVALVTATRRLRHS
jgi:LPXTG-motif cell wall-anchored protein